MEKKLTAMQMLQDKIKKQMDLMPDNPTLVQRGLYDAYLNCYNWATELLEQEKKQIEAAYEMGNATGYHEGKEDKPTMNDGEQYYNNIYNQS